MRLFRQILQARWYIKIILFLSLVLLVPVMLVGFLVFTSYLKWDREREDLIRNVEKYKRYIVQVDRRKAVRKQKSVPTTVYDRYGRVIGVFSPEKREYVPGHRIPKLLKQAVIAMEDTEFYNHNGINIKRVLNAAREYFIGGRKMGGSTITQQLAKLLFTNRDISLARKIFEFFGAKELESRFSKNEILLIYLNEVYFGHATYGVQAASRFYFQKPAQMLDPYESALLAGLIPRPEAYSPIRNIDAAKRKHLQTLNRMVKLGYVRPSVLNRSFETFWRKLEQKLKSPNVSFWNMSKNEAPYFIEFIRQKLQKYFKDEEIIKGGLAVYTTLDVNMQKNAETAVRKGLSVIEDARDKEIKRWLKTETRGFRYRYRRIKDKKKKDRFLNSWMLKKEKYLKERRKPIHGALVSMDASSGYVLAMVGGKNFRFDRQQNYAIKANRQFGSAMKPIVYATALENNTITASTVIQDKRREYMDHGEPWSPKNYDDIYAGDITIRKALSMSINTVAVETISRLGPEKVAVRLGRIFFGKKSFPPILSLPLGSVELTPIGAARVYCTLASGGYRVKPLFIRSIHRVTLEDGKKQRKLLYNFESSQPIVAPISKTSTSSLPNTLSFDNDNALFRSDSNLVLDPRAVYITTQMMRDVLSSRGTAGYARNVSGLRLNAAGKSGTSDKLRDAWFCGYVKRTVAAVWVGYDSDTTPLPENMTGGSAAGPIWASFMHRTFWNSDQYTFPRPDGITTQLVCGESGKLAAYSCTNTYNEYYISGSEPFDACGIYHGESSFSTNSIATNSGLGPSGAATNR